MKVKSLFKWVGGSCLLAVTKSLLCIFKVLSLTHEIRLGKQDFSVLVSSDFVILEIITKTFSWTKLSYCEFSNCTLGALRWWWWCRGFRGGVLLRAGYVHLFPSLHSAVAMGGSAYSIESSKPPNRFFLESSLLNIYQQTPVAGLILLYL